ncbi:hypothetical protein ATN89_17260 [Comamonas thiooxydans]|nr:hypothetical protein ATN89_17260 [Comamonas thiooxydans]
MTIDQAADVISSTGTGKSEISIDRYTTLHITRDPSGVESAMLELRDRSEYIGVKFNLTEKTLN